MRGVGSLARGGDQVWFTAYGICVRRQGPEALKVHQGKGGGIGMNGKMKGWRRLEGSGLWRKRCRLW